MLELLRRYRRALAALVLVVIPLALVALRGGTRAGEAKQTAAGALVRGGVGYGHAGVVGVIDGLGERLGALGESDADRERKLMQEEVVRLREEKARLIGVLQENERLRELVGFKRRHPEFELIPARVVSRSTSPYFRVIQLRIRAEGKVAPRQPVVVTGGVVGQIHEVHGQFADVIILSDPRSRIDTISQRNRAHGVVQGLGHERDYKARIAYLNERDRVRAGDVMVTSGMGGVFPAELIVGTIRSVEPDERGLFQQAVLEPAVDLSRLQEVFVITKIKAD